MCLVFTHSYLTLNCTGIDFLATSILITLDTTDSCVGLQEITSVVLLLAGNIPCYGTILASKALLNDFGKRTA